MVGVGKRITSGRTLKLGAGGGGIFAEPENAYAVAGMLDTNAVSIVQDGTDGVGQPTVWAQLCERAGATRDVDAPV
jgi:hypothetical protein